MKTALHRIGMSVLLLSGLAGSLSAAEPAPAPPPESAPARDEPTPDQKRYLFEHYILPRWTHEPEGAFPVHLLAGKFEGLRAAARQIVGDDYARALRIQALESPAGALILPPKPELVPQCHAIAVVAVEGGYRYFTLELTEDYLKDGTKTCLCEWRKGAEDPEHANLGPRPYDDPEKFAAELQRILAKPAPEPAPKS